MLGLRIGDSVQIDLGGFKKVIDELGGIELAAPEETQGKGRYLEGCRLKGAVVGAHHVGGEQMLMLARTGKRIPAYANFEGSEFSKRFVTAVIKQATSLRVLANPGKLQKILQS